jgi:anaerobic selenocysteine-containing dehydrogenase
VLFDEGLARPGRLTSRMDGLAALEALARRFPPERVAAATEIPADQIRELARAFAAAPSAVCYGRMGVSTQAFGAVCHWLMTALNAVSGNLDRVGGAMFSRPAVDLALAAARTGHRGAFGRWRSRVRGLPEFDGELPAAALAEEIETPGTSPSFAGKRSALFASQIRGLVTVAGNPALSAPGGARVDRALSTLAYGVAIDMYLNETTRHAHLILPPTGPLEREHFDLVYYVYAVHNAAKFAPAAFPRTADARHDWEILAELALRVRRAKRARTIGRVLARIESGIRRWFEARLTPQRLLDVLIRSGPHGDRWNPLSKGLSLAKLKKHAHGVDLGPHVPCLPARLFTRRKRIALAPHLFMEDVARLETDLARRLAPNPTGATGPFGSDAADELELVGRRQLRSNNSWLHNSLRLVKGKERCTLLMHPSDAAARGLETGMRVAVRSAGGAIEVPLEVSDTMMPGVVSLPHGWGHGRPGTRLAVAAAHAGASLNDLTNDAELDALSGAAGFSRVRVRVSSAGATPRS